jgi:pseudoazurin
MKMLRRLAMTTGLIAVPLVALAAPASAREYKVEMANRSADGSMVFGPGLIRIAPGDTVRFVVRDKSHNAESIRELTPAGAKLFKGRIDEEIRVRFTAPGLYGYKCLPHLGMGMVGIVQVGAPVNRRAFEAGVAKLPPLARARFAKYLRAVR